MPTKINLAKANQRIQNIRAQISDGAIITLITDGEHDDIMTAYMIDQLGKDPRIAKINVVLDEGSKDYELSYANKKIFFAGLSEKCVVIEGTKDKDVVLKDKYKLTPIVRKAMDEATLLVLIGPGVIPVEYAAEIGKQAFKKKPLMVRYGSINDEWTMRYVMAHYLSAEEKELNDDEKYLTSYKLLHKMYGSIAQENIVLQGKTLLDSFGEQKFTNPYGQIGVAKDFFNSITPDYYILLNALLTEGATDTYGTSSGILFARTKERANTVLLQRWTNKLALLIARDGLTEKFLQALGDIGFEDKALITKDLHHYLFVVVRNRDITAMDKVCGALFSVFNDTYNDKNPCMDPTKPKDKFDVMGCVDRYRRVVRSKYQLLSADQFTAVVLLELLDKSPSLILPTLTEQTVGKMKCVSPVLDEVMDGQEVEPIFLHSAVKKGMTAEEQEQGLIDAEHFRVVNELLWLQSSVPLSLVKPDAPILKLIAPFLAVDVSKLDFQSPEYAALTKALEAARLHAKKLIKDAMELRELELDRDERETAPLLPTYPHVNLERKENRQATLSQLAVRAGL